MFNICKSPISIQFLCLSVSLSSSNSANSALSEHTVQSAAKHSDAKQGTNAENTLHPHPLAPFWCWDPTQDRWPQIDSSANPLGCTAAPLITRALQTALQVCFHKSQHFPNWHAHLSSPMLCVLVSRISYLLVLLLLCDNNKKYIYMTSLII